METLSCVAHAHWCFHSNSVMTVKSRQHFRASTNRASHQPLTEKIPKGKRSKVWLYFAQKDSNIATCSKCNANCVKRGKRRQESTADQQPKTEKYTEMTAKIPTVVS